MGMWAMGCDFALVGATHEEVEYVQNIIDENRKINSGDAFAPGSEPGSVIMLDSFDVPADYDIGVDLSENGKASIICMFRSKNFMKQGIISYEEKDRKDLLYQLVIMQIGFKFMDVDFNDIMPIFEKGCTFKYINCQKDDYLSSLGDFITKSGEGGNINQKELLIQMIDPPEVNIFVETDECIESLGIQNGLLQVITIKESSNNFQVGLFITK